ncbi:hypothetical protein [Mesorhizobium sp.]|uniref:hypothetical protein n=1 Tax=Mesorhizobium sp. TaxID=1871066 RepID=UPI000FE64E7B|nr:hypothetical protein [Mesorhizobium sp.]RWG02574.1 MAG: hypothetical protein EOQ54_19670 [Mesorhizobium sp.]RWH00795.1 MAG: hypothetical protein EOQ72_09350 [Mesorhizobium sp.]TIN47592.1 MAG: hypothetical protein E5Y25_05220 [Mesorhizobium sp.]TIR92669.1 MAG: hypothetical protein E5X08_13480 [Mesorhizobium sp.]TIS04241.1 MAG: hypothetical protein E5X13_02285 [Mesorhizobium sp.]
MRAGFRRVPVAQPAQQRHSTLTFPAPIRGKISNENLAASKPQGATVLENWFPTSTGIRLRGGLNKKATIGAGPVVSMMTYDGSAGRFLFAADATKIYDVTNPASPNVAPAPVVSGQTSGYYSYVQFPTVGGDYLSAVNGTDSMRQFDGTTWTTVASLGTIATNKLSFVWTYRSREFFVEKNTLTAWFLPVDAISGAASDFSLAGVFQKGGSLLCGGTWSLDAGDGVDDKCVFISTKGEVAVYEGANPADPADWSLVGRYDMSPPRGPRAMMQAGGELLIAMDDGIIPISQAIQRDRAALSLISVSRNIEPDWRAEAAARATLPWEVLKWPLFNMAIVSLPALVGQEKKCFVVNLQTGAWADYTGWDTRCLALLDGRAYFGTSDGKVMQCEVGGHDDGQPYTSTYVGLFDHMKAPARSKTVHMARTVFRASRKFLAKLSISSDYQVRLPSAPASVADDVTLDEWDTGIWDVALWDAGTTMTVSTKWASIGQSGFAVAPQLQVTCGVTPTPDAELVAMDVIYEVGAVVV